MNDRKIGLLTLGIFLGLIGVFYFITYSQYGYSFLWFCFIFIFLGSAIINTYEYGVGLIRGEHFIMQDRWLLHGAYYLNFAGLFLLQGGIYYLHFLHPEELKMPGMSWMISAIQVTSFVSLFSQFTFILASLHSKYVNYSFVYFAVMFLIVYVSCGLAFSLLYMSQYDAIGPISKDNEIFDHVYFSFVTLATTGYGDIRPNTCFAKILVMLENIFGLFLTGYLISMIVSKYQTVQHSN